MRIEVAGRDHLDEWADMRAALWPWDDAKDHAEQAGEIYLSGNPDRAAFIAIDADGAVLGFAEAALRRDWVEGCNSSPVAFLEGIYVRPKARLNGAAKALSEAVAAWGHANGCAEYASNALLDNLDSHHFHAAIGFAETERVVFFRKDLT